MNNKEYYIRYFHDYPKGEIQDFIKLLYQSILGSAHLILDENENYERLVKEYNQLEYDENHIKYEEISDELLRAHLEAIKKEELKDYHEMFMKSVDINSSQDELIKALNEVERGIIEGWIPFSLEEWHKELKAYKDQGYPVVSHSQTFRQLYHPHYRLMKRELVII